MSVNSRICERAKPKEAANRRGLVTLKTQLSFEELRVRQVPAKFHWCSCSCITSWGLVKMDTLFVALGFCAALYFGARLTLRYYFPPET
jgi:hypothetical protein